MQNFIKTIINAVQSWTKKEIREEIDKIPVVQPDWNEKNPNSDNYIKNKPDVALQSDINSINNSLGESFNDVFNNLGTKMDANNPVGTGTFSMNRRSGTTVGDYSHAEGYNTAASGEGSHAEGYYTTASGEDSHAEGSQAKASGRGSHAEGYDTTASNDYSHAEGYRTTASGIYSHVQGRFNIKDDENKYAHIVGNGTSTDTQAGETILSSNAHTLDWNGVGWFQGGLQVGGAAQDAEGVGYVPSVPAAQVGQTIIVSEVDANGKPAKWEAVDILYKNKSNDYLILNDANTGAPYKIEIRDGNLVSSLMASIDDFTYTTNEDGTYTITGWNQTYMGESSTEMVVPNDGTVII